ncbi:MAG: hypothetical protein MI861_23070, partial [Pirellulales bacterium]|nr:hypothetical protein [Pirellulales bacterium]
MKSAIKLLAWTTASLGLIIALAIVPSTAEEPKPKQDRPLERTRRTVRMLDDIYKGGIVAITQHYVNDEDAIPAGTAFK